MPSKSLTLWRADRVARLALLDATCVAAVTPPAEEEALRGYVVLLCAHFQAFCRDLYTECSGEAVRQITPISARPMIAEQFRASLRLNTGNPTPSNIGDDFSRFVVQFWREVGRQPPATPGHQARLQRLNEWRNAVAHHDYQSRPTTSVPLTLADGRDWRTACDELTVSFDRVLYVWFRATLGIDPWPP